MSKLSEKKLFLLDMDGTIYLDNNLFDPRQDVDNGVNSWVEGRSFFCVGDFYLISKENKWAMNCF